MYHGNTIVRGHLIHSCNSATYIAYGNTIQRPTANAGGMRYNVDTGKLEVASDPFMTGTLMWNNPLDNTDTFVTGIQNSIYYGSQASDNNIITGQAFSDHTLYALPFFIPDNQSINRIGISVTKASTITGGIARLGIYKNNRGVPSQLLYNLGTVSTETVGDKEIVFSNASQIWGQWVWICVILDNSGTSMRLYGYTSSGSNILGRISTSTNSGTGISAIGNASTLPSTFPTTYTFDSVLPYLWMRNI